MQGSGISPGRGSLMKKDRKLLVISLVLAGLCLVRIFSVGAAERSGDEVEVYSSMEKGSSSSDGDSRSGSDDDNRGSEIRLTRPDEAAERVADDHGYDLVPGVERLQKREEQENSIIVPRRMGRAIASDPTPQRNSNAEMSVTSPIPTRGELRSDPIEPRNFSSADARARAADLKSESIAVSNAPTNSSARFGLRGEPGPETRIDPPVPSAATGARAGVQEISLIISDYGYFPNKIFVTQGVPVKIYMTTPSKVTLCFMLDNWGLKKGVLPGRVEELSFVPDAPGDYRFYCPVKSIEGTLTVREQVTAMPAGRGVASAEDTTSAGTGNAPKRAAQLRQLIGD